ncbi:bifunctional purine biosynthesis protein PurH [bacterium BMS3Abin15]|nr:bifunctional purine biosynthesis protein PurH [bacterium BMS3Abin15]
MEKFALLSVFYKEGIVDFAKQLVELGFTILSSGGTARELNENGIEARDVATLVGGKAILGHRVVTLSREVHAGLLARYIDADIKEMETLGLPYIDLVCVDMYPLEDEVNNPDATTDSVIEKTDIGGPTMLGSAAKGRRVVVCDPLDRQKVIDWLKAGKPEEKEFLTALAAKADFVVSRYRMLSAKYHGEGKYDGISGERISTCKYGENAHMIPAEVYSTGSSDPLAIDKFKRIAGTDLSYNNTCDLDRLLQTITHIAATFDVNRSKVPLIAIGVKHGNACGASIGDDPVEVVRKMVMGDDLAIFGGLVTLNFEVNEEIAEALLTYGMPDGKRRILDGIIAPSFVSGTAEMFERKNDKCRLVANKALAELDKNSLDTEKRLRYVRGGFLTQPNYTFILDLNDPDLQKFGQATAEQEDDMLLAKAICDTSNSNTITIVRNKQSIGNGVSQHARVRGANLAVNLTGYSKHDAKDASAASDSFFPFVDGPEVLEKAGIKAILSTSGSVADNDIKEFCEKRGIILYLIPDKKGRGFFGH